MIADAQTEPALVKAPTGVSGLDEVTLGGLPRGRTTLVAGPAGSGKTLLAMEFILHGAIDYDEPGVFIAFEETPRDLAENFASLGYDVNDLIARKKIVIDYVYVERSEIEETGEYDLEGLFIRLGAAIDSIGANRIALDTVEVLFAGLSNSGILRAELRRLFRWFKDKGVTAIVTGEKGEQTLTRYGLEEYVADCVIVLDRRVTEQIATRRLRVLKYRGARHGTNEYPFLIDEHGLSVLPVTSLGLQHTASQERMSSGIPRLDAMLGGAGYFRGSSILLSGTAGTGKTSVAASLVNAACRRGERCLWFAFEESPGQIVRNMRSIGMDLQPWLDQGLLHVHSERPSATGLEMHLVTMHRQVRDLKPSIVVLDPISSFTITGTTDDIRVMLTRMVDYTEEANGVTAFLTYLTTGGEAAEATEVGMSSLVDTWLLLRSIEQSGERTRGLYVLKSRGMPHSNQIREFTLSDHGIDLIDVYLGASGQLLTGAARAVQDSRERAETIQRRQEIGRRQRELTHKKQTLEEQIAALRREIDAGDEVAQALAQQEQQVQTLLAAERSAMAHQRGADPLPGDRDNAGAHT